MSADGSVNPDELPRRSRLRLRILLAINAMCIAVYGYSQVAPDRFNRLVPIGRFVNGLGPPSGSEPCSAGGRRFVAAASALRGRAHLVDRAQSLFGNREYFFVGFDGRRFDDDGLARFVKNHGALIRTLQLTNTAVTNAGLRHLRGFTQIQQLSIRVGDPLQPFVVQATNSAITDDGMYHLNGLSGLVYLDLVGLPITDAGLDAIKDLPALARLTLSRTNVTGPGLGRLKSLPRLTMLYLDDSRMTDDGLSHLSGASNLEVLSLNGVPLTGRGLKSLKLLPRLRHLEVIGCGLSDAELEDLQKSKRALRIRQY